MNSILWILLCLFASIGLAYALGCLNAARKRPLCLRRGYCLIPLYDEPALLEEQVRYTLSRAGWGQGEIVLLADMGLGEESLEILERICRQNPGLFCCKAEELADTVRSLDTYQQQP